MAAWNFLERYENWWREAGSAEMTRMVETLEDLVHLDRTAFRERLEFYNNWAPKIRTMSAGVRDMIRSGESQSNDDYPECTSSHFA